MSEILHDWRPRAAFNAILLIHLGEKNTIVMLEISFWLSGVISGTLKKSKLDKKLLLGDKQNQAASLTGDYDSSAFAFSKFCI